MDSYHVTRLDAGVRVITERIEGVRSAAIGFWIGAGSRDEPPRRARLRSSTHVSRTIISRSRST
jgi:predicted Zn-dependent peptidase